MKRRTRSASIRTKTTLFVVVVLGVLTALMATVQFRTSLNRVERIEDEQAVARAERVVRQLDNSLADLGGTNSDWAWWDDSYTFALDGNQDYRDNNLYAGAFTPIGVDLVAYLDADGSVVHAAWFSGDAELPVPDALLVLARPGGAMADFGTSTTATPAGIVDAAGGVFLVTGRAILPSDHEGPPAGVLLMAREIDDAFAAELATLVDLDLVIQPCTGRSCAGLTPQPRITKTSDAVASDAAISAIDGRPVLKTHVSAPRTMYRESVDGIRRVLLILVAVGIGAVLLTIAGLRRLVVDPLERLGSTVGDVARTNDPSLRATVDRTDEIGGLAAGVNVMLARLENSQRQLLDAKAQIEGASEAKSRFLSRVSHELRTPINGVLAYAQLLQLDADDESSDAINQIITAARHITALVDEFLDIARIEAGAIPINLATVAPAKIAAEVVDMTQPLAAAKQTCVQVAGPDNALVLADPLRLRQVLLNLVSNAIKYGHSDQPITVTVRRVGSGTAIDVRDHGPGIPASQFDRLFIPFDRLGADSSDQQGSGVGLSVTKQLIELMNGTIEVASELGSGTTFTLTLPSEEPGRRDADKAIGQPAVAGAR